MLRIKLTQGFEALIDDEDLPLIEGYSWRVLRGVYTNYAQGRLWYIGEVYRFYMHDLILPSPPGLEVNHKDYDGLNNCRFNLELATHSQNIRHGRYPVGSSGERNIYQGPHGKMSFLRG